MNRAARRRASRERGRPIAARPPAVSWFSNAPWAATGYGQQTAQVVRRLHAGGWPVSVSSNYGLHGTAYEWNGIEVMPAGYDVYSQDIIAAHYHRWAHEHSDMPAVLVTLFDVWVLTSERLADIPTVASWVPIDHLPCPPKVRDYCLRPNVVPIAMADFGRRMLERLDIAAEYVPHAIEPVFQPTDSWDGRSGRDIIGCPDDAYVVMINAANKGATPVRKAFAENLLAVSELMRAHSDVWLYIHSEDRGAVGGIDLRTLIDAVGIDRTRVRIVDQYAYRLGIEPELLAALYTAADCLLACSMGEGFGIPVIEAQACGTRAIVSDFSAQPELVGDGWTIDGQPYWDPLQSAWLHVPRVASIVAALEEAYGRPGRSEKAIAHAAGYAADRVFAEHWVPVLERLAEREPA